MMNCPKDILDHHKHQKVATFLGNVDVEFAQDHAGDVAQEMNYDHKY